MTRQEIDKYIAFMYDVKNIHNCECCPHSQDGFKGDNIYPCGQFTCWVIAHCK